MAFRATVGTDDGEEMIVAHYSAVHKGWPLMHDEPSALGSLVANR